MQNAQNKGKFIFINALTHPYSWIASSPSPSPSSQPNTHTFMLDTENETPLKALYMKIQECVVGDIKTMKEKEKDDEDEDRDAASAKKQGNGGGDDDECVIIIDNISVLLNSCSVVHVIDFVHYLRVLLSRYNKKVSNHQHLIN